MPNQVIPAEAQRAAEAAYRETLTDLRLAEGGGFKVASQNRRALTAALEAAAPHMLAGAWDEGREAGMLDYYNTRNPYKPTP